jgi:DNA-binding transcriptional LysR family regulator
MVAAPLMSELLATAPGVDLRTIAVNAETVVDYLDRGTLDLALGAFGAMPRRIQKIPKERFVGVARRVCFGGGSRP